MSDLQRKRLGERSDAFVDTANSVRGSSLLVVGDMRVWQTHGRELTNTTEMTFAEFEDVTPEFLAEHSPEVVIAPLVSPSFDCLDLALVLSKARYAGHFRILTGSIPDPGLVLREIRALCPSLDAEVLSLDLLAGARPH